MHHPYYATSRLATLALLILVGGVQLAGAQESASETAADVSGSVSVTNKGISLIPSFTLGRPAVIFDLAVRKADVGFEPQFRFGLDGKPWSFLLWWRYRPVTGDRFRLAVGGHPSFSFKTISASTGGEARDLIQVRRYVAGEIAPSYALTDDVNVGAYYLYSRGIDPDAAQHTHFLAARAGVGNLRLSDTWSLQLAPQLYFLRTDAQDGTYFSAGITLSSRDLPFTISTTVNQPLETEVLGGDEFLWNVSLNYRFP